MKVAAFINRLHLQVEDNPAKFLGALAQDTAPIIGLKPGEFEQRSLYIPLKLDAIDES